MIELIAIFAAVIPALVLLVMVSLYRRAPVVAVPPTSLNSTNDFQLFGEAFSTQAIVASGGLCAPLSLIYSMPSISVVRDAVPTFKASRG